MNVTGYKIKILYYFHGPKLNTVVRRIKRKLHLIDIDMRVALIFHRFLMIREK